MGRPVLKVLVIGINLWHPGFELDGEERAT
jgi:hypothetical protein